MSASIAFVALTSPGDTSANPLLEQLGEQIRYLHYSLRTKQAYLYWVKNFIRFYGQKHQHEMEQP